MKKEYDLKNMKRRPGSAKAYPEANKVSRTLRLDVMVMSEITKEARRMGIPYQTLINSVLHRFVTGELVDKPKKNGK